MKPNGRFNAGEKAARLRLLDEAARPGDDIVPFTRPEIRAIASSIRKDVHQLTTLHGRLARLTNED